MAITEKCGAKTTRREGTCQQPAGHGTWHVGTGKCKFHGGNSPSHRERNLRDQAAMFVEREKETGEGWYGDPDETADPVDQYQKELQRCAGHVAYLQWRIAQEGAEKPAMNHGLHALYQFERDRLARLCRDAMQLGLDERIVMAYERSADKVIQMIEAILGDLGHDVRSKEVDQVVKRHLQLVA